MDQTNVRVEATCFNTAADIFYPQGTVLELKDCIVSSWNDKSLAILGSDNIRIEPDNSQAKQLKAWWPCKFGPGD